MKKTFVDVLLDDYAQETIADVVVKFAEWLDAEGYKPKKSRWVKFEATADSVCPVDGEELVSLKYRDGYKTQGYGLAKFYVWNEFGEKTIIAYKVKKGQEK